MSKEIKDLKQRIAQKIVEKNAIFEKKLEKGVEGKTPYVGGSLIIPDNNISEYFEAKKPIFVFPEKGINMNSNGDIRRYNLPQNNMPRAATQQEIEQFLNTIPEVALRQIRDYFFVK